MVICEGKEDRKNVTEFNIVLSNSFENQHLDVLLSEPPKIAPFDFSGVMNEGSFGQLSCVVTEGDEPLALSWSFHGHNLTSGRGITITNIASRISMLVIASVDHKHMGTYTCKASNQAGYTSHSATLRVNGKLETREGENEEGSPCTNSYPFSSIGFQNLLRFFTLTLEKTFLMKETMLMLLALSQRVTCLWPSDGVCMVPISQLTILSLLLKLAQEPVS